MQRKTRYIIISAQSSHECQAKAKLANSGVEHSMRG